MGEAITKTWPGRDPKTLWWPHRWITATHVCRHWREVAISCPRLWNRIALTTNADRVSAFLSRSKRAPLTFYHSRITALPHRQYLALVSRHLDRTVSIYNMVIGTEEDECLSYDNTSANGVELPLQNVRMEAAAALESIPVLSTASLPRLHTAKVQSASFYAIRNFLRPTMTCLHLHSIATPPSIATWLNLLRDMPLLEDLDLHKAAIPPLALSTTLPSSERVRLDRIRRIGFGETPGGLLCTEFIKNLILPPNIHVSLGLYDPYVSRDYIPTLQDLIRGPCPDTLLCLGFTPLAVVSITDKDDRSKGLIVAVQDEEYEAASFIVDMFSGVCLPHVKRLSFRSIAPSFYMFRILQFSIPNVEDIGLSEANVVKGFIGDMEEATSAQAAFATDDSLDSFRFFSNLKTLSLCKTSWDIEYHGHQNPQKGWLYEDLEAVLRLRLTLGYSRLKRLSLEGAIHLPSLIEDDAFMDVAENFEFSRAVCGDDHCGCWDEIE